MLMASEISRISCNRHRHINLLDGRASFKPLGKKGGNAIHRVLQHVCWQQVLLGQEDTVLLWHPDLNLSGAFWNTILYMCIYIYMCVVMCIYIYIYIFFQIFSDNYSHCVRMLTHVSILWTVSSPNFRDRKTWPNVVVYSMMRGGTLRRPSTWDCDLDICGVWDDVTLAG